MRPLSSVPNTRRGSFARVCSSICLLVALLAFSTTRCTATTPTHSLGAVDVTATMQELSSSPNLPANELSYSAGWSTPQWGPLPVGAKGGGGLSSVACPSPGACFAVGGMTNSKGKSQGYVASLVAGRWTTSRAVSLTNSGYSGSLSMISCPSPSFCVAGGTYHNSGSEGLLIVEVRRSEGWLANTLPLPPGAKAAYNSPSLTSLSCPVVGFCVAAGTFTNSRSQGEGYLDRLSNGRWTAAIAPLPPGLFTPAGVSSVSCVSKVWCVAVGTASNSKFRAEGFIDTLATARWTPMWAPLPASDTGSTVSSVSCLSMTSCQAVGNDWLASGHQGLVIDRLSGSTWRSEEGPLPSHATAINYFVSISFSCATPLTCVVVGAFAANGARSRTRFRGHILWRSVDYNELTVAD